MKKIWPAIIALALCAVIVWAVVAINNKNAEQGKLSQLEADKVTAQSANQEASDLSASLKTAKPRRRFLQRRGFACQRTYAIRFHRSPHSPAGCSLACAMYGEI